MKTVRYISFLTCLVLMLAALCLPVSAVAADDQTTAPQPVPADNITISTDFPRIDNTATGSFQFNVTLDYTGQIDRIFDLKASVPSGWDVNIQPQYQMGTKISSITIQSSFSGMSKQLTVVATPPSYPIPDAGDYKILLQATAGNVTGSIPLVARITAKYALTAIPINQLYNTSAQAGKSNIYSIQISNTGSAALDGVTFTSTHPDGWEITFSPTKLDSMKASDTKTIDVNIKPPPKTVSGDYMITLSISGTQATADKMDIRVTVNTPTIWGWVSVIIILVVVAGLFLVIMRFGRR